MADELEPPKAQAMDEKRTWTFDYSLDLATGVTISSVTATHTPPTGSASVPVIGTISGSTVPIQLGTLSVTGSHYLEALATLSDTDKSSIKIKINVPY